MIKELQKEELFCDCDCHKHKGTMHFQSCCTICPVCGKWIKIGFMSNHLREHCDIASLDQLRKAVKDIGLNYTMNSQIDILRGWFHRISKEKRSQFRNIIRECLMSMAENMTVPEALDFLNRFL